MRKTKGFSYDPEKDMDVIKHINKQQNGSQYIWDLVRKDMKSQENNIEHIVKKYIEKYLKNFEIKKREDTADIDVAGVMEIINMK